MLGFSASPDNLLHCISLPAHVRWKYGIPLSVQTLLSSFLVNRICCACHRYPIGIPVALLTLLFRQRRALDDTCDVACAACNTSELEDPASEFVPIFHESHLQHELSARDPRDFLRKGLHMPNAVSFSRNHLTHSAWIGSVP